MKDESNPHSKRLPIFIDANDTIWVSGREPEEEDEEDSDEFTPEDDEWQLPVQVHLGHGKNVQANSKRYLKKELEIHYHQTNIEDLYEHYYTHPTSGLDEEQVKTNREKYGNNILTIKKDDFLIQACLKAVFGGFQFLLWICAILSFMAYLQLEFMSSPDPHHLPILHPNQFTNKALFLGKVFSVLAVVLSCFVFCQEYFSRNMTKFLSKQAPSNVNVIRDEKLQNINADALVVGDIVQIKIGERVPADVRIIECSGFKVDSSLITGDTKPQMKCANSTDENFMDSGNLAFFGTNAVEGTAKAMVVAVGHGTLIGRIVELTSALKKRMTPLSIEILRFGWYISVAAISIAEVFYYFAWWYKGYDATSAFTLAIELILPLLPEGLLISLPVILALAVKRMENKSCLLMKHLHSVETLGSCTVICTDKTGTLTQNKMTVSHLWCNNKILDWDENSTVTESSTEFSCKNNSGFATLVRVASLCCRAEFVANQEGLPLSERKIIGDASESALLRCMAQINENVKEYQASHKKVFEIPFNPHNRWQLSIHILNEGSQPVHLVVMKGAPERLIGFCTKIIIDERDDKLDSYLKSVVDDAFERLGGMGERVLGFCEMILPSQQYPLGYKFKANNLEFLKGGMTFAGLISLTDPLRPGVADAVLACRTAGIKVVMITGDHIYTAKTIAKKVNIISEEKETLCDSVQFVDNVDIDDDDEVVVNMPQRCTIVVSGDNMMGMTRSKFYQILRDYSEIVFARVSPQQKLVIVEALQELGNVVAVTGDGDNDFAALKKADIGVTMGTSGSILSKVAADMILLDGNFSSVVIAVEEGRRNFDNLRKCLCYLLAPNVARLCPLLVYWTVGMPLALDSLPMLLIALAVDILPTIALSFEPPEGDLMQRPPRNPQKDNLFTRQLLFYSYGQIGLIETAAGFFAYFVVMAQNGFFPRKLLGIQAEWEAKRLDLVDSYFQEWSYSNRKCLERTAWTSYFCAVVICQCANVLISKVRRAPLHTKIFKNWFIWAAIVGEALLACFFIYTPGLNSAFSCMPLKIWWWLPGLPFALAIILYDEIRRLFIRKFNI